MHPRDYTQSHDVIIPQYCSSTHNFKWTNQ